MSNTSTKKQADIFMAGALGLLVVCMGLTLWLHQRYLQAADGFDAARRQLHFKDGALVMPETPYTRAIVDARLRTFLVMCVLTGLCAIGMAIIVLWHRKQRLKADGTSTGVKQPKEIVGG